MKLYLACVGMMQQTYGDYLIHRFVHPEPKFNELRSYYELKWFTGHTLPRFGKSFFIDSGAFSAYSQGVPVTAEEYGNFLEKYQDQIDVYANLDAIPKGSTPSCLREAAEITMYNQMVLEARGVNPLPVFHMGEPWEYLEHYLENYEYICVGGLVDTGSYEAFFDKIWSEYLIDGAGRPTHKVHAFGMTAIHLINHYPWHSADSSTWLVHSKIGYIAKPPRKITGEFDFTRQPKLLAMSDNSTAREREGEHFDNLTPMEQEDVREYLALYDLQQHELRNHPVERFIANLGYWIRVEAAVDVNRRFRAKEFDLI